MGFIASGSPINTVAYLTQIGRDYLINGSSVDYRVKYFGLGDSDTNYNIAAEIVDSENNILANGFVPNISGDQDGCIKSLANGYTIKHTLQHPQLPIPTVNSTTTYTSPDGTVTTITINPDGSVTQTNTSPDGTVTTTTVFTDGTVTTTTTDTGGTTTSTTTDPEGNITTVVTTTNDDGTTTTNTTLPDGTVSTTTTTNGVTTPNTVKKELRFFGDTLSSSGVNSLTVDININTYVDELIANYNEAIGGFKVYNANAKKPFKTLYNNLKVAELDVFGNLLNSYLTEVNFELASSLDYTKYNNLFNSFFVSKGSLNDPQTGDGDVSRIKFANYESPFFLAFNSDDNLNGVGNLNFGVYHRTYKYYTFSHQGLLKTTADPLINIKDDYFNSDFEGKTVTTNPMLSADAHAFTTLGVRTNYTTSTPDIYKDYYELQSRFFSSNDSTISDEVKSYNIFYKGFMNNQTPKKPLLFKELLQIKDYFENNTLFSSITTPTRQVDIQFLVKPKDSTITTNQSLLNLRFVCNMDTLKATLINAGILTTQSQSN